MLQAGLLALLILIRVIPWLGAHVGIMLAGIGFWLATEIIAPDRKEVGAQAAVTRTFNAKVRVSNERVSVDGWFITVTVRNDSNARIYDFWLRCSFQVPQTRFKPTDPEASRENVSTDFHYGYIAPGAAEQISLALEPNGLLPRAIPSSFSCEPRYQHEATDLFLDQG
ncbi:hypothetical protein ACFOYU_16310 [Microvirga sp. GCM10011540]|uniref:hypothetical protein n=1 Tax=Microvirga sp. GCM10011540 TaxID=3317338 RepID=UPI00360FC6DA